MIAGKIMRPTAKPCGQPRCTLSLVDGEVRCQCLEVVGVVVTQPDWRPEFDERDHDQVEPPI